MTIHSTANPVLRAELRHQRHVISTSRAGRVWIGLALVLLVPAAIATLIYLVVALIGTQVPPPYIPIGLLAGVLIIMNIALYIVVTLMTMGLAANSISREQTGKTWDTLLLTTLNVRQIIWGKWWATLRALWGDHALLGWLRLGLVAWIGTVAAAPQIDPLHLLAGLCMAVGYTVAEAGFSAALGLIAPLTEQSSMFVIALLVRLVVMVVIGLLIAFVMALHSSLLMGLLIGLGLLVLLTVALLRLAEMLAVWQQAAPAAEVSPEQGGIRV